VFPYLYDDDDDDVDDVGDVGDVGDGVSPLCLLALGRVLVSSR